MSSLVHASLGFSLNFSVILSLKGVGVFSLRVQRLLTDDPPFGVTSSAETDCLHLEDLDPNSFDRQPGYSSGAQNFSLADALPAFAKGTARTPPQDSGLYTSLQHSQKAWADNSLAKARGLRV